jgi:hypothetical protein
MCNLRSRWSVSYPLTQHKIERPERTIREWDPKNGWREFKLPVNASKDGAHETSR